MSGDCIIDFKSKNPDLKPFLDPFRQGEDKYGSTPKTLLELSLMRASGLIRSKPRWYEKYKDQTIREEWKQEILEQDILTEKQIDYVLAELEYYDEIRDGAVELSAIDGTWQSDELIPVDLKSTLINCCKVLEDVPESKLDWHPGTNKQVLDLVHPSMFCFVSGVTPVINSADAVLNTDSALNYSGDLEAVDVISKLYVDKPSSYSVSKRYQWLPAEFKVSKGGKVKIESYINNLHPVENASLYRVLEEIFERFVPLFNKVLDDLPLLLSKGNRINPHISEWYERSSSDEGSGESGDDYNERNSGHARSRRKRRLMIPDVGEFVMPLLPTSKIDLRGRQLQVIVKLSNILLTPLCTVYPGGAWHVEGMENEHIVATGIYYYSSSNISLSQLIFRHVVSEPRYQQYDHRGVSAVFGLENNGPLNQPLGGIITQEDRCIVFPNVYQHRVAPFELIDKSQPGHRKILLFFLVDPALRILSTAKVPPQQTHWYPAIGNALTDDDSSPVSKKSRTVSGTMTIEEANEYRQKLMDERKYFFAENSKVLFERPFSLWKH